jgi:hypothetical protein
VYNPEIEVKFVNKEEKWYELNLNLPPLGAILLK